MYTIQTVANAANISHRTLRYYDNIGLLVPSKRSSSGYRLYNDDDVLRLQQILIFKELGLDLKTIQTLLHDPSFDLLQSLQQQSSRIQMEQERLTRLQMTIEETIRQLKGGQTMPMKDAFEGLKETTIASNDTTYGEEIRSKYEEETVEQSYTKMRKMSKWEWDHATELATEILTILPLAMDEGPTSKQAIALCQKHQEWIQLYWPTYSKEAHLALCEMYTEDERFTQYYDKVRAGAAAFLLQAMRQYLN